MRHHRARKAKQAMREMYCGDVDMGEDYCPVCGGTGDVETTPGYDDDLVEYAACPGCS